MEDPEGFARALAAGKVRTRSDQLFAPSGMDDDDDDDDDEGEKVESRKVEARDSVKRESEGDHMSDGFNEKPWPTIPTPQSVVRCPPINWTQYAVIGDSLDKLHADQQARPTDGLPAKPGPDGNLIFNEGPRRLSEAVVAAPYTPGKDRIEKPKKSGKR